MSLSTCAVSLPPIQFTISVKNEAVPTAAVDRLVPSMVHAGKWAVLLAAIGVLLAAERRYQGLEPAEREHADRRRLKALATLTPDVPEASDVV